MNPRIPLRSGSTGHSSSVLSEYARSCQGISNDCWCEYLQTRRGKKGFALPPSTHSKKKRNHSSVSRSLVIVQLGSFLRIVFHGRKARVISLVITKSDRRCNSRQPITNKVASSVSIIDKCVLRTSPRINKYSERACTAQQERVNDSTQTHQHGTPKSAGHYESTIIRSVCRPSP